ncbi:hypothetical protein ACP70R_034865 [Stipagrostis hirtigluma subsp. patula]
MAEARRELAAGRDPQRGVAVHQGGDGKSMNSFLVHLARTAPPGGEHDEQVRAWMNQVRVLAQDYNNCLDLYLYRGNPDIHRARGGLRRYLWWLPWLLQKLVAQHRVAIQLRELEERARDVGKRRLRYGVEVPGKMAVAGQSSPGASLTAAGTAAAAATPLLSTHAAASIAGSDAAEGEEEDEDHQLLEAAATDQSGRRGAFFEPRSLEDYIKAKLADWIKEVKQPSTTGTARSIPCISIVAPTKQDTRAIANEAMAMANTHFDQAQSGAC